MIISIFALVIIVFYYFLSFSLYKMLESKTLKVSIRTIINNPEMLWLVPDHLKTEKTEKYAIKKFTFVIKYGPDKFKTK